MLESCSEMKAAKRLGLVCSPLAADHGKKAVKLKLQNLTSSKK